MTATALQPMTTADAFREILARQIALVPSFDGRIWTASTDEKGTGIASKKRKVRQISASASSPIGAIRELIATLDGQQREDAPW